MPKIKYRVKLSEEERERVKALTSRGKHSVRSMMNALILLNCDQGKFQSKRLMDPEIEQLLNVSNPRIWRVKRDFVEHGLDMALNGRSKGRPSTSRKIDGEAEAHIIALSCSTPPKGHSQWSIRLLTKRAIELKYVDSVSHMTVQRMLKKTNSNLGKKFNGLSHRGKMVNL